MKNVPIVLSASRRTDVPAFYMDRFMAGIRAGAFEVENPFNRSIRHVPATPRAVHSIVFWSKNYAPFLQGGYGESLKSAGYALFFHFTVNAADSRLEPGVPPLGQRLDQLDELCRRFGPGAVSWRFDPVCFYRTPAGAVRSNLHGFGRIADAAAACGIRRCITSFMDPYPKVIKRAAAGQGVTFLDPPPAEKIAVLKRLAQRLQGTGISLQTCCEKEVLEALPDGSPISAGACIPSALLADLFGAGLSRRRDPGQRVSRGCRCGVSVDIGSYRQHPCFHNCLFCYANPRKPGVEHHAHRFSPA